MAGIKALLSALLIALAVFSGLTLTRNVQFTDAQLSSDDWTMFHYDPAHTGYTPTQALTSPPVVVWSAAPELIGAKSSPAIANGVVYVTSAELHAYNASTGEEIWHTGSTSGNPIVNGDIVYCGGIAYNAFTGTELWSPNPAGAVVNQAFSDGYLYAQQYTANFPQLGSHVDALVCVNATTGTQIWSVPTNFIASDPAVANGMLYVAGSDNNIHAFNAATGAQVWNYTTSHLYGGVVGASPTVYDGIVYAGSYDYNVYALNATDGTKIWNYTTGFFVESCPAVANGIVYVSSDDGNLYALNAENGAKIWNYTTSGGASSPAVAGNVVYVGGADGNLYALDASNGNKLWNFTLQPLGQVYNGLLCSPAVVDGRVYIGSNTHVMTVLGEASNVTPTSSLTPTASPTKPSTTSFSTELVIAAVAIAIVAIAVMALWLRKRASRKITH